MSYEWITPLNVVTTAKALLALDISAIQEPYQGDLQTWVFSLQNALNQYQYHDSTQLQHQAFSRSSIELIEYHLQALLRQTRAFIPLLTLAARVALQEQMSAAEQF